jgi:hypothetical protein
MLLRVFIDDDILFSVCFSLQLLCPLSVRDFKRVRVNFKRVRVSLEVSSLRCLS